MDSRKVQGVVGALTLLVVVAGGALSSLGDRVQDRGYEVTALFNRVDGLAPGSPVWLAGLKVGEVADLELDGDLRAMVTLRLDPDVQLPRDTAASVRTRGVLGEKYISLEPGADFAVLEPGGRLTYTQDSVVLQELLQLIIERSSDKSKKPGAQG